MRVLDTIGQLIPEGTLKNKLRSFVFSFLFTPAGVKEVLIGPPHHKIKAKVHSLLFYKETLAEREIDGYLQEYTPKSGEVVINAGGYHGHFAIYLSQLVGPTGRVFCFEPEANNLRLLRKNLALNNCHNVTVIPKGLWNKEGSLPMVSMGSGSRIRPEDANLSHIQTCSLDTELALHNASNITFMAMDIEGAELEALEGAKNTIINNRNIHLAIASYHMRDGQKTASRVESILTSYGMRAHTTFPTHLTTYASFE